MARGAAVPESERLATHRRERFCQEYLKDLNATKAAARAGYSPRSARACGSELLHIPEVEARVAELLERRAERTALSQDEVIQGLRAEATYFGPGSSHAARVSAFQLLGKHQRMFVDVVETKDRTLEDLMREAAAGESGSR